MLILHIAGLRIFNGKSVTVKSCNIVKGKRTTDPVLEERDAVDYLLERSIVRFKFYSNHTKLVMSTATKDFHSPNTMSSVTFSSRKVKLGPASEVLQLVLGKDKIQ